MAPKKRTSAGGKKSTLQNRDLLQSSQPSRYGIQHFFERHSQSQNTILENSKKENIANPLKPISDSATVTDQNPKAVRKLPVNRNPGNHLGNAGTEALHPRYEANSDVLESAGKRSRDGNSENNAVNSAETDLSKGVPGIAVPVLARADVDCRNSASGLNATVIDLENVKLGGKLSDGGGSCQARDAAPVNSLPPMIDVKENQLEVSPEASKSSSVKRFKFSPGMLIKQSQDDATDEVTWKISPVNEKLHSMSKHLPGMIRVLADSSRFSSMGFQQCSQKKMQTSPGLSGKFETWVSSPPPNADEKSLVSPDTVSCKKVNKRDDTNYHVNNRNSCNNIKSELLNSQSPFSTPPSLSCCHVKALDDVDSNGAYDQPGGSRQHKKALIELLDQVEDVISVDHSLSKLKFLVLEVSEKHEPREASGPPSPFKMLRLLNEQSGAERALLLWDEWYFSVVAPGDIIHVIGEFDSQGKCDVNHEKNFLIVYPDILVSGTRVSASFSCPRRTILDERLKHSEHSVAALIGTLLHQIFQAGLIRELPTKEFLEEYARTVIQKNLESIYACEANEVDIWKTLVQAVPKILNWISCFRDSQGSKNPSVDFKCDEGLKNIKISEIIDIEEMVWAPKFGLKGMIDASVRVRTQSISEESTEMIMPLEFKTGKGTSGQTAMEHSAQVMLYTLLMSERYMTNIEHGLLYYLQTDHTQGISVRRSDLIGLIMRRNELANDLRKAATNQQLPPMLQSPNMCKGCRHLNVCTIYHKAYGGTAEGSGLGDLYDSLVSHLTTAHTVFLRKWERLVDLEAKHLEVLKKENWGSESYRNDQPSIGVPSLVLDACDKPSQNKILGGSRFVYRFVPQEFSSMEKEQTNEDSLSSSSSLNHMFRIGDYVILSTEPDYLRVANGIIVDTGDSHVSVSFSKRLRLPGHSSGSKVESLNQQSWRLDKDEVLASFAIMRYNLVQLFLQIEASSHLRKMIVDLEMPRFDSSGIFSQDPSVSYVWSQKCLNDDQQRAILKILTAKDYALILGMPGTGKTSTMVHAVKALLMRGSSILLTSYTNSAVDNLLVKLKAQGIDFIRIGRHEAVHEEVQENCISAINMDSTEEIKRKLNAVKVVAVTCLGISSPLLSNKRFDICIMDEAGQITLPVSLGPLTFASKFVLVGDHYQLPPLVQSPEAKEYGMSVSLFCRLSEAHPQAIAALHSQYRMCASIMELSNALIYGNRLRCGSPEVENGKLMYRCSVSAPAWLMEVLNPNQPVIFINTDLLPAYEANKFKAVNNPTEAYIVAEVTKALILRGIQGQDIGIITPYNSQANLIQGALSEPVEIHTIDKYQGRDKDCILVSFVRSCENSRISSASLLGDWHRINVALTRAKKKMIMVGSRETLSKVPLLKLLIEKVEELSGMLAVSKKEINYKTELKRCSQFR